jgi:hypothetical protein
MFLIRWFFRANRAVAISAQFVIAAALLAGGIPSPVLAQDPLATTTTILTASADRSAPDQSVTFTARVIGSGGIPTGMVIFKDGSDTLGTVPLSADGSAIVSFPALTSGEHTITAQYSGDTIFAASTSLALTQTVQPAAEIARGFPPGVILTLVIVSVALLLLLRRFVFRIIGRIIRILGRLIARLFRMISKPIIRLLRLLRIVSKTPPNAQPAVAVQSVVGLSAVALAQAFSGETEEAIARNFDTDSIRIQRNKQFFCTWLRPLSIPHVPYGKEKAEADLESAKHFFSVDIPTDSNPLNLYDDIDGAFIVNLLKDSDKVCFHVLSEFKKAINGNVIVLSILFSFIVSVVAVANLLLSTSIDFYSLLGLAGRLPLDIELLGTKWELNLAQDVFNKMIFGSLSCLSGYSIMWFFYHTEYAQFQRYNGQQMNNFLVDYLANINSSFRQIHTNATQTILEEKDVNEMKHDTALWITNLQWTAFRAFFIEHFLKNMLFQIRRNSSYYLLLIPLFFILSIFIASYVFHIPQFNVFDFNSEVYRQNTFYLFFAWLLFTYYGYLSRSVTFIWESIDGRGWFKFRELNIQDAMTRIMDSYVVQLDRWRSMMKSRG